MTSGPPPYVELHAHSAFSFLDGASTPMELARAAGELGYEAFALTDHDGVWGSMEFVQASKDLEAADKPGVRAITGAEVTVRLADAQAAHLTLLVEDAGGYRSLCRLLTAAHAHTRETPQRRAGQPSVSVEQLEEHAEGLLCLSGCAGSGMLAVALERGDVARGAETARRLLGAFGRDRFRIELQRPFWRRDRARNRWLAGLAERLGVPTVATGNVHSHHKRRAYLQDVLVGVRLGMTLEESEPLRRGNRSSALAAPGKMAERFADHPDAVTETLRLAERLEFDLSRELGYRYPREEEPGVDRKLAELCRALLAERYEPKPELRPKAEAQLEEELQTIRALGLSGFFLLHHDLLELAREVAHEVRGRDSARAAMPPGRGRGSSVSSVVCYLTGLSHIDPIANDLNSSRFLNEEVGKRDGATMPDIDLDFPRDIREVLIPRVHERYGADHSALVAAFPTYRPRGAVRDLGKVLGLPQQEIEKVAGMVGFHERSGEIEKDVVAALGPERAADQRWRVLLRLCPEAMGLPRHASQHSGGMVISTRPLIDVCPVVPAAMEGRQIVQWDKDSCNDAGFLKIDLLGLGMLSAVERCVDEVARTRGERLDLSRIPFDDARTFESIRAAETTGVFQIESRAQMSMLPRTRPETLDDLTVQVALVRPGPIQGGAVHPYIERLKRRREDPDGFEVPYEHPSLRGVLDCTLGTIVFQEQVIEVAIALAGFSAGEADSLRRAMSRKRSEQAIEEHHENFIAGAGEKNGVPEAVAERVWDQIQGFSGFGFPKAHSAAFGLLAYQSAWLRVHRPQEFLCGLLNEQPMGFYPPDALVHEAQRRGVQVLGPDANRSRVLCHVEPIEGELAVRIGLGYVKGARSEEMESLLAERERSGDYAGIADLASRSGAGRDGLERLAWAGALDDLVGRGGTALALGLSSAGRREALWEAGGVGTGVRHGEDVQMALPLEPPRAPELKPLSEWERLIASWHSFGITLDAHPLGLMRDHLDDEIRSSADLEQDENGATVVVAGFVVARQRPGTANGIVFMLLEDEIGTINLVVPPPVYERCRAAVRAAPLVRAVGRLERHEGTTNVVVSAVTELPIPKESARQDGPNEDPSPQRPAAQPIKPRQRGTSHQPLRERAVAELRAVAPNAPCWGRRR
ncbi:MAG TPA: error-prone DNA polymerase [Solirubrobacterales bacterium]|nr:error-prone DNA polymerase [Solirubrobacterales bacterium]